MKRLLVAAALIVICATDSHAQQYPIMDKIADKVAQKYRNSSCAELMARRDQPRSQEEKNFIQFLQGDPQMRRAFIDRVAAPIANKLFECRMIP